MAETLKQEFVSLEIPVFVDSMGDFSLQRTYHLWPDGAIVIHSGTIRYISRIDENGTRAAAWTEEMRPLLNDILFSDK
jgi:hypothetical protein